MDIAIADWIEILQTVGIPSIVCAAAIFFISVLTKLELK